MHGPVRTFTAATDHGQVYLVAVPAARRFVCAADLSRFVTSGAALCRLLESEVRSPAEDVALIVEGQRATGTPTPALPGGGMMRLRPTGRVQAKQDWTLRTMDLPGWFTVSGAMAAVGGSIGVETPEDLPGRSDRHSTGDPGRVGLVARPRTGATLPSDGPDGGRR